MDSIVHVSQKDLPLSCPQGHEKSAFLHPRVYLAFNRDGLAICPYCQTHYRLATDNDA